MSADCKHGNIILYWIPCHIEVEGGNGAYLVPKLTLDGNLDRRTRVRALYTDFGEVIDRYIEGNGSRAGRMTHTINSSPFKLGEGKSTFRGSRRE